MQKSSNFKLVDLDLRIIFVRSLYEGENVMCYLNVLRGSDTSSSERGPGGQGAEGGVIKKWKHQNCQPANTECVV